MVKFSSTYSSILLTLLLTSPVDSSSPHRRSKELRLKHSLASSPINWLKIAPAPEDGLINLHIALKQSGIEDIRAHLRQSSDPSHRLYGNHLTFHDIQRLSSPSEEAIEGLDEWFWDHGIEKSSTSHSGANVRITLPVGLVQEMLNTTYHIYRHNVHPDTTIIRTEEYSIPSYLHDHIDVISPTTWFSNLHVNAIRSNFRALEESSRLDYTPSKSICNDTDVTNACLRTFYGSIDYVPKAAEKNSIGVTGYLGEIPSNSDLQTFLADQRPDAKGMKFTTQSVNDGPGGQTLNSTQINNGTGQEANLDVQTAIGVTYPTPLVFWSTGGTPPFIPDATTTMATNEPYLDWLNYVLALPDSSLPSVITTSYGDDEQTVPKDLALRICDDLMKLTARGVSLIFSSGDFGVGQPGKCVTNDGKKTPTFLPTFPASCPYVTAVGATKNFSPEIAANTTSPFFFFSSGGFSNYFARPSYQDAVIPAYIRGLGNQYSQLYNASGRGYPDVAANGDSYRIVWNGSVGYESGTSASAPLFASFVSLLNDARIASGKSALGFLNPWLYSNASSTFNDITSGSSAGCNTTGFPATTGWDAVTGFGTPNFTNLLNLATNME